MTQAFRPDLIRLASIGRRAANMAALALLLAFKAGCSEEFQECVAEWQECKEDCPTLEEEEAIQAAADAERDDCLDGCAPLPQGGRCIRECLEDHLAATAQVGCNAECDEELNDCVEAIQPPAALPAPLARQVGASTYEVDRKVLAGLLSSPLGALQGATVVPVSIDLGAGFVLVSAEPGAVLRQLGARPGDVLTRIAGQPVSAASFAAGMHGLLTTGQARATLVRADAQLNQTYRLR
jgi:hypothetical protein